MKNNHQDHRTNVINTSRFVWIQIMLFFYILIKFKSILLRTEYLLKFININFGTYDVYAFIVKCKRKHTLK